MSAKPQPRTAFNILMERVYAMPEWGRYSLEPDAQKAFKAALLRLLGAHGWTPKTFLKIADDQHGMNLGPKLLPTKKWK